MFVPALLQAQSGGHHHKKATTHDTDGDDNGTPTPSPSASTTPKPAASSADEAAPSKAGAAAASDHPAALAAVSTIDPAEIEGFDTQSAPIKKLLAAALDLTKKNLTYTYGSSDPASGGMDCSGTIYYLLKQAGFDDVPRQASEQYEWVRQKVPFLRRAQQKAGQR